MTWMYFKRIKDNHLLSSKFQRNKLNIAGVLVFMLSSFFPFAQTQTYPNDSSTVPFTLGAAVDYAIKHQPQIQQSYIDQEITEANIRSRLADWYPQISLNYNAQHNFLLPTNFIGGNEIKSGSPNTSAAQFTATQVIFNRDVLLARRTKADVRLQSRQATSNQKIDLAVDVSKAFYDVITTTQQINVARENIIRTERSLRDALAQYNAGIVDKIDYKRATITLNNVKASQKSNEELLRAKTEYLKSLMGYPDSLALAVIYDSTQMEREISLDTLQLPDYTARIEYSRLETQRDLLKANLTYNKWSYLPNVAASAGYNLNYQNKVLSQLFGNNYPNSYAALTLSLPIFQGGKRKFNIKAAELELDRNDLDIMALRHSINAEFAQAMAGYKRSLANYLALKENVDVAKEVYDVIQLQYRSGIKTYLEVITAETDLRTAQINYFNALNEVLADKLDVQRALGQINYQ
jgi:outer membrane protein